MSTRRPGLGRRRFLQVLGAGGVVALGSAGAFMSARRVAAQVSLTPFVDPLPVPAVIKPVDVRRHVPLFQRHDAAIPTEAPSRPAADAAVGLQRAVPGPTFETRRGRPIDVLWRNNLPNRHLLQDAIDDTLHGDEPGEPFVRTVVHLHGAKVQPDSDGYPEAWFTNGFARTGPFFENRIYHYPNDQRPRAVVPRSRPRHDATERSTGLTGFYLIRDNDEDVSIFPAGISKSR